MRKIILRAVAVLGVSLLAGLSMPAQAITLQTGESAVFNFDFSSANPAPPYAILAIDFSFQNFDGTDQASFDGFGGLDATGALISLGGLFAPINFIEFTAINPALLDGVFSTRVTATSGPFDVNPVTTFAFKKDFNDPTFDPALDMAVLEGTLVTSIPEPASLALIGGGMVGAAAFRRRARR